MSQEDDTYVLSGPESHQQLPEISLGRFFYDVLGKSTQKYEAMVDAETGQKLSYKDILETSLILAQYLNKQGYGKDSVFCISSENNLQFFAPILASFFIGAIMAPVNHNYTKSELEHCLSISKPRVIFCSMAVYQKYQRMRYKLLGVERIIVLDAKVQQNGITTLPEILLKATDNWKDFRPLDGNPAELRSFILCSSGTTGLPKGVLLSHRNILARLVHQLDPRYYELELGLSHIGILPFFHAFGLITNLGALLINMRIVVMNRFDPKLFLQSIEKYRISILWLAPPLVVFLAKSPEVLKYDLSSVRSVTCGAAPLGKAIEDEVKSRLKIATLFQGYGLTEATLAVTLPMMNGPFKDGSSGRIMPFMQLKIRDPTTGKSLPSGQVGEVCLKGPMVMMGYYNNQKSTKETFTKDNWLLTGDLGYYDQDGFVFIVDRLKELIKYKGFQVAPAELEALLLKMPQIRDVGVVGLADENCGELPLAFVVKHENVQLSEKDVQDYVQSKLSNSKWLRGGVRFVKEIPKNPSGKILRRELRDMLRQTKSKL